MAVTIATQVLPNPSEEDFDFELGGTAYTLADGTIQHDNVESTGKRIFSLTFRAVSSSVMNNILTAYNTLMTTASTYTNMASTVYNITGTIGRDKPTVRTINSNPLVYDVTIKFKEA